MSPQLARISGDSARHGADFIESAGEPNHQATSIDHLVESFLRYIQGLSPEEAMLKAGVLSEDFWLRDECQI